MKWTLLPLQLLFGLSCQAGLAASEGAESSGSKACWSWFSHVDGPAHESSSGFVQLYDFLVSRAQSPLVVEAFDCSLFVIETLKSQSLAWFPSGLSPPSQS